MIWELVDTGTRIALLVLIPTVYVLLRRDMVRKHTAQNTRLTHVESSVKKLKGLSTLPQATRAEVEMDIKKALEPLNIELKLQGNTIEEIRDLLLEGKERTYTTPAPPSR